MGATDGAPRVLVTGATGFLGRRVVAALRARGARVSVAARDPGRAAAQSWGPAVEILAWDLYEPRQDWFARLGSPARLVHLAWDRLDDFRSPTHLEAQLPAHQAFLGAMLAGGLRDLTVTGTCLEYGLAEGCLAEDAPTRPVVAYGQAKDQLRGWLARAAGERGARWRWLRLFYLLGEDPGRSTLFTSLARAAARGEQSFPMSPGQQVRDYAPVAEAAGWLAACALQDRVTGIINCASGRPVKLEDLVREHMRERGCHLDLELGRYPYNAYEPLEFWADTARLREALDAS
ncbi:MAG: NAD(P)-dependent oxidoreductase [Deltaproteobacteria bacterium]|nr:NAD(P)-dependent oxidoreductase [Deltaproteobacteria bacterium]